MWIFFGQLCQTFRLSAVFVFGIGRSMLALGSFAGTMTLADTAALDALTPFGPSSGILFYMAALVVAYMFLPRVRDIKRMIDPDFEHRHTPLDDINDEVAELDAVVRDRPRGDASGTGAEAGMGAVAGSVGASASVGAGMGSAGAGLGAAASANAQASGAAVGRLAGENAGGREGEDDALTRSYLQDPATSPIESVDDSGRRINTPAEASHALNERAESAEDLLDAKTLAAINATRISGGGNGGKSAGSSSEGAAKRKGGRFRTQCETIANRYLLSRRETEVLFLLAKGYNAAYIQKKLCITQSTAKTHIYHIYQKLDIHTQQELLAMVSEESER